MKLKCSVAFPSNLEKEKCWVYLGQMRAGKTTLVSIITGLIWLFIIGGVVGV